MIFEIAKQVCRVDAHKYMASNHLIPFMLGSLLELCVSFQEYSVLSPSVTIKSYLHHIVMLIISKCRGIDVDSKAHTVDKDTSRNWLTRPGR